MAKKIPLSEIINKWWVLLTPPYILSKFYFESIWLIYYFETSRHSKLFFRQNVSKNFADLKVGFIIFLLAKIRLILTKLENNRFFKEDGLIPQISFFVTHMIHVNLYYQACSVILTLVLTWDFRA
jgi:hypothetical protein